MELLVYNVSEERTQIRIKVGTTKPLTKRASKAHLTLSAFKFLRSRKRGMTICTRLPPIDMREETLAV